MLSNCMPYGNRLACRLTEQTTRTSKTQAARPHIVISQAVLPRRHVMCLRVSAEMGRSRQGAKRSFRYLPNPPSRETAVATARRLRQSYTEKMRPLTPATRPRCRPDGPTQPRNRRDRSQRKHGWFTIERGRDRRVIALNGLAPTTPAQTRRWAACPTHTPNGAFLAGEPHAPPP